MGTSCSICKKTKSKSNVEVAKDNSNKENAISSSADVKNIKNLSNINEVSSADSYFDKEDIQIVQKILNSEKEITIRQIKNYKKGALIGEGSYGKVYQGFDEDLGQIIAIKEIDLRRINHSKNIDSKISSFQSEIDILSKLNHKNIVKYYGTKRTAVSFQIFLEFCIGGSIAKMLEVYKFFSENIIRKYTRQILEGLQYLHAHNVIHRDIKGANILVEREGLCKLSDFGGAKVIKDEIEFKERNSFKGTPNWMAPETIKNMEYTRFSDIWSLGCLVIEMSTGEPPWAEYKNPMAALYNLMHTNSPPEFPSHLSDSCKHFLSCCLKINPRERLNVNKLLAHPFILEEAQINYEVHPNFNIEEFKRSSSENSKVINNSTSHKTQEKDKDSENKIQIVVEPQEIRIEENSVKLPSNKTFKEDCDVGERKISIKKKIK